MASTPLQQAQKSASAATTRLSIDLGALAENWRSLRDLSTGARGGAAVKADAYGIGAEMAGPRLALEGCRDFFVADATEGAKLRPMVPQARIYVLNGVFAGSIEPILSANLIPVVNAPEQAAFWFENAGIRDYALHIDTGMNRLGLTPEQAVAYAQSSAPAPLLVMSHFACADDPGHALNATQIEDFNSLLKHFPGVEASLANSAGIFLGPQAHHTLTRPGIALYGANPVAASKQPIRNVVTAQTRILQIRSAKKGQSVSYSAAHVLSRDTRIAVCGIGYADGFLRSASGAGVPLRNSVETAGTGAINGVRVPVIGKITMDLTMFDITDLPANSVEAGDWIEILGPTIGLNEAATAAGTISYEILTALGRRYQRHYTI